MRDYGKVQSTFWTSDDICKLSNEGRMLALYLLTGPHTNQIGCFRLPDGYVAEDLKWNSETVSKGFQELHDNGFATHDSSSKWVVIHAYLKWNEIENPNQGKSAARLFDQVPNKSLVKAMLAKAVREYSPRFPSEILTKFETVSEPLVKPFRNQEQEQEQEQEQKQEQEQNKEQPLAPAVAAAAKKIAVEKDEPNPLNLETWNAYKLAYTHRYTVAPVRDSAINTKIKNLVKALGEEAPAVAAFFVSHNGSRYVGGMHQIGFLSTDYAKLRTEWATNTKMTSTKALQADKTATNLDAFAPLIAEARAREEAERNEHAV